MVRASAKMSETFVGLTIDYRTVHLPKLHAVTVTYLFEGTKLKTKHIWETFVDFDICHRTVKLRKIAIRDLDLLFEGKTVKLLCI